MRLIDADALQADMMEMVSSGLYGLEDMIDAVIEAPTIDPESLRARGEWIEDRMDYKCSACGKAVKDEIIYMLDPYQFPPSCPYCGAKMEVSVDA